MKLRQSYSSLAEWLAYAELEPHLLARLGYKTPAAAWRANPTIEGSVNPSDFRKVPVKRKKYTQYAIVVVDNFRPTVTVFKSNRPLTIEKVAAHLEQTEGFDEGSDSLYFVGNPSHEFIR